MYESANVVSSGMTDFEIIKMILLIFVCMFVIGTVTLLIAALQKPKKKFIGVIAALVFGPTVYIYVNKWLKMILLWFVSFITGGIFYPIIWLYSIFNIVTEVNNYNDSYIIRQAEVAKA